jgi:hypothetical protein
MHIACWITKAASAYSECVIRIAFPQQQLLHAGVLVLRYTYIAYLGRIWHNLFFLLGIILVATV